jgi:hypothetical protein
VTPYEERFPELRPMNSDERAQWFISFVESQIRAAGSGTLGRPFIICPYCATENMIGEHSRSWCCELMAKTANAVIDRIEQQERTEIALRAIERDAEDPPLVSLY